VDGDNNKPGVSGDSDTGTNNSGGSSNGNTSDGNGNGEGTGNGGGTDNGGDTEGNSGGTDNGGDTEGNVGGTDNGGDTEGNVGGTDNGGDTSGDSSNVGSNSSFGYGVYTSNPEIWNSYGNNGALSSDTPLSININETKYKGVRLASDEKPGEVTSSSISKENSKMSFYAKGIKESTLTVSVTGANLKNDDGTSTSKNIKLEKDSTQTFANATYTFTITDKDHYVFDLVDVTDDFKVTFRAEKGNVCFVWGVNYE
jgi:hypothetical protein